MASSSPAVELSELSFAYAQGKPAVVSRATLTVRHGARLVLVGLNGAGKSTLMSLIAGKRRPVSGRALALGEDAFESTALANRVTFVTNEWVLPVSVPVAELLASAATGVDPARVRELVDALDAGPLLSSDIGSLSDGQRRRVQLLCTLLPPRELVLLDEVTNSLDVLARSRLLRWLRESESERRGATIVFCSHIFDGLDGWATDVAHVDAGAIAHAIPAAQLPPDTPLHAAVALWLAEDRKRAEGRPEQLRAAIEGAAALEQILAEAAARAARRAAGESGAMRAGGFAIDRRKLPADGGLAPAAVGGSAVGSCGESAGLDPGGYGGQGGTSHKKPRPDSEASGWAAGVPARLVNEPEAAMKPQPPPQQQLPLQAAQSTEPAPQSASAPPRPPSDRPRLSRRLPAEAERMEQPLVRALGAVEAAARSCAEAVEARDLAALSQARARLTQLWAQTQLALTAFDKAAQMPGGDAANATGGTHGVDTAGGGSCSGSASGSAGGGARELPFGWGSRQVTLAEDELLSRGIIAPLSVSAGRAIE